MTSKEKGRVNQSSTQARSPIIVLFVGCALAMVAAGARFHSRHAQPASSEPSVALDEAKPPPTADDPSGGAIFQTRGSENERTRMAASQNGLTGRKSVGLTEPVPSSAAPQEILTRLGQLESSQPLKAQQAAAAKQDLDRLVAEGPTAVTAIAEFLKKNQDATFDPAGTRLVGAPSVRAALLEVLRQIGGPAALTVSHDVVTSTTDPLELALAARNLEQGAPGTYQQESLDAARQMLIQAADGKIQIKDAAPLFQVLQTYGTAAIADDIKKLTPNWNYFAPMALAGLPSGEGIPSLVDLAEDPAGLQTGNNKFSVQMLAQLAAQYPDASTALLEMASKNQIGEKTWLAIAEGLGGNQYHYTRELPQNLPPVNGSRQSGRSDTGQIQSFYGTPLSADLGPANVPQRLAIIDQLMAVTTSSQGLDALARARARLTALQSGN